MDDPTVTETTPTTLLGAVNTLLRAIGATEVMSLATAAMDQRAQGALRVLNEQSVVVQSEGWHFNEEREATLMPDSEGIIRVPPNAQAFRLAPRSSAEDIVQRGGKLYDLAAASDKFTKPVHCIITYGFEFADIPAPIRWLIVCSAGVIFGAGRRGDNATYRFTTDIEEQARSKALQFDTDSRGTTLPMSNPHFAQHRRGRRG